VRSESVVIRFGQERVLCIYICVCVKNVGVSFGVCQISILEREREILVLLKEELAL
jgi:hypothetical protein